MEKIFSFIKLCVCYINIFSMIVFLYHDINVGILDYYYYSYYKIVLLYLQITTKLDGIF